jgi:uncharacterized membrane protein HdeD (DUF308 family)
MEGYAMFGKKENNELSYFEQLKKSYLVIAVCYVVFGLCLAFKPETSTTIICFAIGALCIIYSAETLIKYFSSKATRSYFEPSFILAVLLEIAGIVIIIRPDVVISIMPVIVGIILVISGVVKLQDALALKKDGYERWGMVLVFSLISVGFGVIMLLNPFGTGLIFIRMVGIFFIIDGGLSIFSSILLGSRK